MGNPRWAWLVAAGVLSAGSPPALGQIATDGTMGAAGSLTGPSYVISESLGTRIGDNLFHSFRLFNIATGESATFTGTADLRNVLSRVTGGSPSSIDGLLRSQVGQANVFLINPAGVVFGPNAQVDVPAAFHVSTADELRFPDGGVFSASDPSRTTLSIENPESFGFLAPQPAAITINGSFLSFPAEQPISITAGDISVGSGAYLLSRGGNLMLTAVGAGGTAVSAVDGVSTLSAAGQIELTSGAVLDIRSLTRPSDLVVRAGNIDISNSLIWADHYGAEVAAAGILLDAPTIAITDAIISVDGYGDAPPSGIAIFGDVIAITRSSISSRQFGDTPVEGLVWMEAFRQLTLDETHVDVSRSGNGPGQAFYAAGLFVDILESTIRSDQRGSGRSAEVEIAAGQLKLVDSKIGAVVLGSGTGPHISFTAFATEIGPNSRGAADADFGLSASLDPNADLFTTVHSNASGSGGDIDIRTNELQILDGVRLLTDNYGNGGGSAGDIRLRSEVENIFFPAQAAPVGFPGLILLTKDSVGSGPRLLSANTSAGGSGNIEIRAESQLEAKWDSLVESTATGQAHAGSITLDSGGPMFLVDARVASSAEAGSGTGQIMLSAGGSLHASDSSITADAAGAAEAGEIRLISENNLELQGSKVGVSGAGPGLVSSVSLTAAGSIALVNSTASVTAAAAQHPASGLVVDASGELLMAQLAALESTDAGDIEIDADEIIVRESSIRAVSSLQTGAAPNVDIAAQGDVYLEGGLIHTEARAGAAGGNVSVDAGSLTMLSSSLRIGSNISSSVESSDGLGGSLGIRVGGSVEMGAGSRIQTRTDSDGNAGDIGVIAQSLVADGEGKQNTGIWSASDGPGDVGYIDVAIRDGIELTEGAVVLSRSTRTGVNPGISVAGKSLHIDNRGNAGTLTGIQSEAIERGPALIGEISVDIRESIEILDGGSIFAAASGAQDSAPLVVRATDLTIDGAGTASRGIDRVTGIGSRSIGGSGDASDIAVTVSGTVDIRGGGAIFSLTSSRGKSGAITVDAGAVRLSGDGRNAAVIATDAELDAAGNAGPILVEVDDVVELISGGWISSGTAGTGNAGNILVRGNSMVADAQGAQIPTGVGSDSVAGATGTAGSVRVHMHGGIELRNGVLISARTEGVGDAGSVSVSADSLRMGRTAGADPLTAITTRTGPGSSGDGGITDVRVHGLLELDDAASIDSVTDGSGSGGQVRVLAGSLRAKGGSTGVASITATAGSESTGDSGDVLVDVASRLELLDGAEISSATFGPGAGGDVAVAASDVLIDGYDRSRVTGISAQTAQGGGDAGDVAVNVRNLLQVTAGGQIEAQTASGGDGGDVSIRAGTLLIDGAYSGISTRAAGASTGDAGNVDLRVASAMRLDHGSRVSAETTSSGDGGSVFVAAQALALANGSMIRTDSTGAGRGGDLALSVAGDLRIAAADILAGTAGSGDGGMIRIDAIRLAASDGASVASETDGGVGRAGDLRIAASESIRLAGGSTLSAATQAAGRGGDVLVSAPYLGLDDGAGIRSSSGPSADGRPGLIEVNAGTLDMAGASSISAESLGTAAAGRIAIHANRVELTELSTITTDAEQADGGQIAIAAGDRLALRDSRIATSVLGRSGDGGNIDITTGTLDLDSGYIQANTAAPGGSGGEIRVRADPVLSNGGPLIIGGDIPLPFLPGSGISAIQAAAADGVEGVVRTSFVGTEVAEAQTPLATPLAQAQALLASGCLPQGRTGPSSLLALGAPGLMGQGARPARVAFTGSRLERLLAEAGGDHPVPTVARSAADAAAPRAAGVTVPETTGTRMTALTRGLQGQATQPVERPRQHASGAVVFTLKAVRIEGGARLPTEGFEALYATKLDAQIGLSDLEALRYAMTKQLVDQGFVSSGVVLKPDQVIGDDGEVVFQVVEGRLSEVRVTEPGGFAPGYIRARVTPDAGRPLNRADIEERFRLLLKDPLIDRIDGRLLPGPAPGSAVLDVRVTRTKPWALFLRANNFRPPSTGSERVYVGGSLRNLTGFGETLELYLGRAFDGDGGEGGVDLSIPVTAADTRLFARYSRTNASLLQEPLRALDIESSTWRLDLGLSHPLLRTPERELTLGGQFTRAENETTVLGEPFSLSEGAVKGESTVSAARLFADYAESHADWALALRSVFSVGVDWWNPTLHDDERPDSDFFAWLGQGQYVQRLNEEGTHLTLRAGVQLAADKLLPLERFAVGGAYSVRGYRENALVGDNGYYASAALRHPVWRGNLLGGVDGALDLSVFSDVGSAWVDGQQSDAPTLWSVGLGGHLSAGEHLRAELSWAHRLREGPDYPDYDLQDSGIQFQLGLAY